MVWDVVEAWGDDPPSRPVFQKPEGMDPLPPKPPFSDLADASSDSDVSGTARTAKTAKEGMDPPSFPAARTAKTAKAAKTAQTAQARWPEKNKGMDSRKVKLPYTSYVLKGVLGEPDIVWICCPASSCEL